MQDKKIGSSAGYVYKGMEGRASDDLDALKLQRWEFDWAEKQHEETVMARTKRDF